MPDPVTTEAQPSTTQPPVAPSKYDAFFGPPIKGVTEAAPAPAETSTAPSPEAQAPKPEKSAAIALAEKTEPVKMTAVGETEKPGPLAEVIRQQREARQAKQAAEAQSASLQKDLEEARAQLARYSKVDIVADPLGWAEAHKLTPEEIAVLGETFLYSLVPEKAPAEWRVRLLETQTKRKERLAQTEAELAATEAERARALEVENNYVRGLDESLQSVFPGTYPESEAWFGEDREDYLRSLFATANNLAEAARSVGKRADLSFKAVAKVLEDDFKVRLARRGQPGGAPTQTQQTGPTGQPGDQPGPDKQTGGDATSTTTLGGNGTPRPPATSEAERIKRATEVAFRSR